MLEELDTGIKQSLTVGQENIHDALPYLDILDKTPVTAFSLKMCGITATVKKVCTGFEILGSPALVKSDQG